MEEYNHGKEEGALTTSPMTRATLLVVASLAGLA
jgi:hypothetical protein